MKKVSDEQVVNLALQMGTSINPITDLISNVRQTYKVSDRVAGNAVRRVLTTGYLTQVWTEEFRYSPSQAGNITSSPYWKVGVAKWIKNQ